MKDKVLIYGANGYTGRLLIEALKRNRDETNRQKVAGTKPSVQAQQLLNTTQRLVLAGRNAGRLAPVAQDANLPWVAVGLENKQLLDHALRDVAIVLNLAGPFIDTAEPMTKACIRTGTHYLDVAGEYQVFRRLDNFSSGARNKGVLLLPGIGFTVFASDLLSLRAANDLSAKYGTKPHFLRVALSQVPLLSRGSLRTMLDCAREGVIRRRNGILESVPVGQVERSFNFGSGNRVCTLTRLPDPYTGRYSTDIPNIEAYVEANAVTRAIYQLGAGSAFALQQSPLNTFLQRQIALWPNGPSDVERKDFRQIVVVEAEDCYRRSVSFLMDTPNSYDFTLTAVLEAVQLLIADLDAGIKPSAGFQTPAQVFGARVTVDRLPNVKPAVRSWAGATH